MEEISVTFYKITECGYFKKNNVHQFGDIAGTLAALKLWIKNRSLKDTQLVFEKSDEDIDPTYIYDLIEHDGEYLLCTWNESESTNGEIATVQASGPVGTATVDAKSLKPGTIPGFATYFWFIPDESIFATIRFQHRKNGQRNMQRYLQNYLNWSGPHVVQNLANPDSIDIVGYTKVPGNTSQILRLFPKFRTALGAIDGEIAMLRSNVTRIRKITRRTTLRTRHAADRVLWQKMVEFLTFKQKTVSKTIPIEYTVEVHPTLDDLNAMYSNWQEATKLDEWDDYGFILQGEPSKPYWLGHGKVTGNFKVNPARKNIEIVDIMQLLRELQRQKASILRLIS